MNKLYEPTINEEAYLSEDEENQVVDFALKNMEEKNMSFEERDIYLQKFPKLRMFACANRDILGEEKYKELEQRNAEIIRTRTWEK